MMPTLKTSRRTTRNKALPRAPQPHLFVSFLRGTRNTWALPPPPFTLPAHTLCPAPHPTPPHPAAEQPHLPPTLKPMERVQILHFAEYIQKKKKKRECPLLLAAVAWTAAHTDQGFGFGMLFQLKLELNAYRTDSTRLRRRHGMATCTYQSQPHPLFIFLFLCCSVPRNAIKRHPLLQPQPPNTTLRLLRKKSQAYGTEPQYVSLALYSCEL